MDNNLILNISHINPKSLDLDLSFFSNEMIFQIFNPDGTEKVKLEAMESTISNTSKTLFIPEDEYDSSDDDKLLSPNTNYTLKISLNGAVLDEQVFSYQTFPAPTKPVVKAYGNRLLEIQFDYPIRHLDDSALLNTVPANIDNTNGTRKTYATTNFYIKYFKEDSNQSNVANPKWPGYILPQIIFDPNGGNEYTLAVPFKVEESSDSRRLLIQSNIKSLPIGTHSLQVATSKIADHSLSGLHLADFAHRDVPISEVDFTLEAAQFSAEVEKLSIINPQTVEVKFSKPVIDFYGKITVASISSVTRASNNESVSVSRKPNTLDTLIFYMNANTFISGGENTIIVSDVVDCYGLIVSNYEYSAVIDLPVPEILSILQDKDFGDINSTKVDITFSHPMNKQAIRNIANYEVTLKGDLDLIPVTTITFNVSTPVKTSLIFTPQLESNVYTLTAKNLVDIYLSNLVDNVKDFTIVDTTRPRVLTILGTEAETPDLNDSILIKFSEHMKVNDVHGINKGINFKLSANGSEYKTLENLPVTLFEDNSWVRYNLKDITPLSDLSRVMVGYIGLKDIFYVTDSSDNIIEFCESKPINKFLPILNITSGSAAITDLNEITYTLPSSLDSEQSFDSIAYKEDFLFKANGENLIPATVTVSPNRRSLIFTFENVSFSSGVNYTMELVTLPKTEDILNRPIKGTAVINIFNELRPEVLSSSTVWVDNVSEPNDAILALRLSSNINVTHINDFIVYNGMGARLNISKASITNMASGEPANEGSILELTCKSPLNTSALATDLIVSTGPEAYRYTGLYTTIVNAKLKDVNSLSSVELYPLSANTVLDPNNPSDFSKATFEIVFSKDLDILEEREADGTIKVPGTLVQSIGPNPTIYGETLPFASLNFNNIFELRSDRVSDPSLPNANNTFEAKLKIDKQKLTITFNSLGSNVSPYFENRFVFFELLPVGYKLIGKNDLSSLNESITVKLPFRFPTLP